MMVEPKNKYRWDAIAARMPKDIPVYGVEVGVWRGGMSARLLEIMPRLYLIMVDWWKVPPEGHSYFDGSIKIARMSDLQFQSAYEETLKKVEPYHGRYRIIKDESTIAASRFSSQIFDFVFIDGDHSYEGVMRDLSAWMRTVKPSGYIGGHDYDHPQQGKVKDAVLKFFEKERSKIELDGNRTWFVKKGEPC